MSHAKAFTVVVTPVVLGAAAAHGQANRTAEEVTRLLTAHRADYVKGDADAWAAMYLEDALFVGVGNFQRVLEGRTAIREYFAQIMKEFPSRTADPSNLRVRVYNEQTTPTVIATQDGHVSQYAGSILIHRFLRAA